MTTGEAHKLKIVNDLRAHEMSGLKSTGRPVLDAHSSRNSEWNFDKFLFVVVRSFTADSNLLQPTVGVNRTPSHVTFSRICMHSFQCRT